jgi:putative chitinase
MYKLKAKVPTIIKDKPEDSKFLFKSQLIYIDKDKEIGIEFYKRDELNHYCIEYNGELKYIYIPHWEVLNNNRTITLEELKKIYPYTPKEILEKYEDPLKIVMDKYEINRSLKRIQFFLAQIGHESGGLKYSEELASGEAYEGRKDLGNIYKGDGKRYKGRGLIQLTGRHNYTKASNDLKIDFVNFPELAKAPLNSALIAGWYWDTRCLNVWSDKNNFEHVTRLINGGHNGMEDRLKYLKRIEGIIL